MRNSDARILLIVVRREPVIVGADEDLEEEPGAPGEAPEEFYLVSTKTLATRLIRPTDTFRDLG
jgi:hypothetical protein